MLAFIAVHKLYLAAKRQLYNDRFIQIKKTLFFMLQVPNYAPKATFNLKRLNFTHNKGLDSATLGSTPSVTFLLS